MGVVLNKTRLPIPELQWGRLAIVACVLWGLVWGLHFYLGNMDATGVFAYAKWAEISKPISWYNPFFPVGNVFTLFFIPIKYAEIGLHLWNVTFFIASIGLMALFFDGKRVFSIAIVVLTIPLNFQYAISPTADTPAAFFTALAALLVFACGRSNSRSWKIWFWIGFSIGLACLFRRHPLAFLPATILFCFIQYGKNGWKLAFLVLLGFLLARLPQTVIEIVTGNIFSSKAEAVNILRVLSVEGAGNGYGFFFHYPRPDAVPSVLHTILQYPDRVFPLFFGGATEILKYGAPALVCALLLKEPSKRYFSVWAVLAVTSLGFAAALGGSPRFPLVLTACYVVPIVWLFDVLWAHIKSREDVKRESSPRSVSVVRWLFTFSLVWLVGVTQVTNFQTWQQIYQRHYLAEVFTQAFERIQPGFKPSMVYTTDLSLYFPSEPDYTPVVVGGWGRDWMYHPEPQKDIPTDSAAHFLSGLKQMGVDYLLLDTSSYYVAPFLFDLYQNEVLKEPSPVSTSFLGDMGTYKAFRLVKTGQ